MSRLDTADLPYQDREAAKADQRPALQALQGRNGQPGTAGRSRPGRGGPSAAGVTHGGTGAGRDRGRPSPRWVRAASETTGRRRARAVSSAYENRRSHGIHRLRPQAAEQPGAGFEPILLHPLSSREVRWTREPALTTGEAGAVRSAPWYCGAGCWAGRKKEATYDLDCCSPADPWCLRRRLSQDRGPHVARQAGGAIARPAMEGHGWRIGFEPPDPGRLTAPPASSGGLRRRCRARPVRIPAAADVEGVAILPLGWTPGRREVVAEGVTALGRDTDSLGDLRGGPLPHGAFRFAQLHPVNGRIVQVVLAPGVVGDQAEEMRARDADRGP